MAEFPYPSTKSGDPSFDIETWGSARDISSKGARPEDGGVLWFLLKSCAI